MTRVLRSAHTAAIQGVQLYRELALSALELFARRS